MPILSKQVIKNTVFGLTSMFAVLTGCDVDSDSMAESKLEQRKLSTAKYLDNQGCDGDAFLRGETQYCPDK